MSYPKSKLATLPSADMQNSATADVFVIDPSIKARRKENRTVILSRIVLAAILLVVWEWACDRWIPAFWISSPSRIANATINMWNSGELLRNLYATVAEALVGFAFGIATGMLMGVACGTSRMISKVLDPFLVGFYSIPRIALIPLFILYFGIGFQTKVIYIALLVFFPVFMNTLSGVRDVNQDLIDVIRVMGASRADTVRKILIPSALAWLFTGLRISVTYALTGAIVAEMFTSNIGLGYLVSNFANQVDTASQFATLAVTTALGLVLNAAVVMVEKRLLRWRPVEGS